MLPCYKNFEVRRCDVTGDFDDEMTRLDALQAWGLLVLIFLVYSFLAVLYSVTVVGALFFSTFLAGLALLLGTVDNLILKFLFGFKKTWLSTAVEFLVSGAKKVIEEALKMLE